MFPPKWATVLGIFIALVGKLAARSDHRPARHRFALAPSRLLGNLGIRLMSPLCSIPTAAGTRIKRGDFE
jgi:hypothetical protein